MTRKFSLWVGLWLVFWSLPMPATGFQVQTASDYVQQHPGVHLYGTPFHQHSDVNDDASTFGAIYGTTIGVGATPLESAWNHIHEITPFLGEAWGSLVPEVKSNGEVLLPLTSPGGGPGFYTFRFNQQFGGLPVFRSGAGFLVRNEPGNPVVVSGIDIKNLAGFDAGGVGPAEVTRKMLDNVRILMDQGTDPALKSVLNKGGLPIRVSDEELVIFAGVNGVAATPQVAVKFVATRGSVQTVPDYKKFLILAAADSGDILLAETQIHNLDITGSVHGRATTGLGTLECGPETEIGLPYAEVLVVGGNSTFADINGNFSIPHSGNSEVLVRSRLRGQWFEVFDQSIPGTPQLESNVTPPGPVTFLHNPSDAEFPTASVNAYLEANVVRDFVLNYQPGFPVIGSQQYFDVYTNINDACNAYYDGLSINFFRAALDCNNTSMSDVVYHEYGHHLIQVTGNGQAALGEGSGDVMGVLIQDEPILALGFQQDCGVGLRTADNALQYPCSGGSHFCGQLISGAVWDTRHQLAVTEPSSYRDINSALFLGMLMVRGQMLPGNGSIDPFITILYLQTDDDDADINNGTPHYNEIANGFGMHGLDAPELTLMDYVYPTGRPELIPDTGGVLFNVEVQGISQEPEPGSAMMYVDRGNGIESFPMNQVSPNVYQAEFPPVSCSQVVKYYFSSRTMGGFTQYEPAGAPGITFTAIAGAAIVTGFADNFETDTGWFEIGDALDGFWERGVPAGNGGRGDPPTDGDGSGQCFVTGNFPGNSDVDDGYTRLVSPLMNAVGGPDQVALLTYRRWYSNNTGLDPENDILLIELSNNGGGSFVTLEVVGPGGTEVAGGWIEKTFRISDFVTPTDRMRLTFNCSDYGDGSIVEAGVDAVAIRFVSCELTPVISEGSKLLDGVIGGGAIADASAADDQYLEMDPSPTVNPVKQKVDLLLQSTSPQPSPASLRFRLEARMLGGPEGDVLQEISLRNYLTDEFESIDFRPAENTDSTVEATASGDASRFVQPGTREITARLTWTSGSFAGAPYSWSVDIDEAVWLIQ